MAAKMAAILNFTQNYKLFKEQQKLKLFRASQLAYDIIKQFAALCRHFTDTFPLKKPRKQAFLFKMA